MIKTKENSGITLVALVVTIIVLLILAGVSLRLVAGGEGILGKASNADEKNKRATLNEELELLVSEYNIGDYEEKYMNHNNISLVDYIGEQLPEGTTKTTASGATVTYRIENNTGILTGVLGNIKQEIIITGDGTVTVKEAVVITPSSQSTTPFTFEDYDDDDQYDIGEVLTYNSTGEKFLVISDTQSTVTLLAKNCLKTSTLQGADGEIGIATTGPNGSTSTGAVEFSSTNYWYEGNSDYPLDLNKYTTEETLNGATAIPLTWAREYGQSKGGSGRLMRYDELQTLLSQYSDIRQTMVYRNGTWGDGINYWLGTAVNGGSIKGVYGTQERQREGSWYDNTFAVRPVIEIDKTEITKEVVETPTGDPSPQSTTRFTHTDSNSNEEFDIGEEVEANGEVFYVMKVSDSNVTLLSKDCINATSLEQDPDVCCQGTTGSIAFSSEAYWNLEVRYPINLNTYEHTRVATDAIDIVEQYAETKLGLTKNAGRLLTYEEANTLKSENSDLLYGKNCTKGTGLLYWLGTTKDHNGTLYVVNGFYGFIGENPYDTNYLFGVRPVIEISKSKIQ